MSLQKGSGYINGSGYPDPTAGSALSGSRQEQERPSRPRPKVGVLRGEKLERMMVQKHGACRELTQKERMQVSIERNMAQARYWRGLCRSMLGEDAMQFHYLACDHTADEAERKYLESIKEDL